MANDNNVLDAIDKRIAEIKKQLSGLEIARMALLESTRQVIQVATPTLPILPAPTERIPRWDPPPKGPFHHRRSGQRKGLLLALFTGPASEADVCRAMGWSPRELNDVARSMFYAGVVMIENGVFSLTEEGITRAKWFMQNPKYVAYAGGPNGYHGIRPGKANGNSAVQ